MKTYHLVVLLLFVSTFSFAQIKRYSTDNDLPTTVIKDFSTAVNYAWKYANNKAAFKGALIPYLQQRGLSSPFEIERTIQNVGKSKSSRNLVLVALADYTGISRLNQILLNMDVPANSAKTLTSYAYGLQQQNANFNTNLSPTERNGREYIVIAPKAYLYSSYVTTQKNGAYLMEGEKFVGAKEFQGFVYVDFTNSTTKRKSKGWILKMDIETSDDQPNNGQINDLDTKSPFYRLKKYDGEKQDIKKVYSDSVVVDALKTIIGKNYINFKNEYLSAPLTGTAYVRHNVFYITSFVSHFAPTNATFFIDLKTGKSFLYWNTINEKHEDTLKTFGETPLTSGIINFIQHYKNNMQNFTTDSEIQLLDNIVNYHDPNEIFNAADADVYPEFPKGNDAFYKFLANNLKYPLLAKQNKIAGIVHVQFVVEKDGTLTDIKITKGLGNGCDEEVVRVMKLSPSWRPAKRGGVDVRARYIAPIAFRLTED